MNLEKLKDLSKKGLKGLLTALILTMGITVVVHLLTGLYDYRIIAGVLAGKFGFDAVYGLLGKIKGLE